MVLDFQGYDADKLPPQNIEAEEAILGGILLDPEAMNRVVEVLNAEAFYVQVHQTIYQAAQGLHAVGQPTDLISVTAWLRDRELLDKVGGQSKLAQLVDRTVSAVNIDQYAALVMDKYFRRQLIQAGQEITGLGFDAASPLETTLDKAEQKIFGITQKRPQQDLVPIFETLIHTFQELETQIETQAQPGFLSGFYDLDAMTGGFQLSDLIIVAGRPSMGKCLHERSQILLGDGSLVTVAELYHRRHAQLLTLDRDWRFRLTEASDFIDDGVKPVFRVTTRLGRAVETTLTHPYLTVSGWRSLAQLQPGDRIAVPRRLNVFGDRRLPLAEIDRLANEIRCQLRSCSMLQIPPIVFQLQKSQVEHFLSQVFGVDIFDKTSRNWDKLKVLSLHLARQLQHLLLRFGKVFAIQKILDSELWILSETESDRASDNRLKNKEFHASEINFTESGSVLTLARRETVENNSQNLAASEVCWDEIVSIDYIGDGQVYDLTIPETHNFVANDICVHNTAVSLNIAHNIANAYRLPVAVFSLEMSKEQLVQRLLASEAGIESNRLRAGRVSQNEWEPLSRALASLSEMPIFIDDTANITVTEMRSKCRRLQAEQGKPLGLILLDYLQLMEGAGDNRVQELSRITRSLKGLARELNVPVIALSQLSRGVEARNNKRPMMSDLRESGSIEQDADLIVMLYRDEYYNPDTPDRGITEMIIAKHRNGPTGMVKLLFDPQYTRFRNLATPNRPMSGSSYSQLPPG